MVGDIISEMGADSCRNPGRLPRNPQVGPFGAPRHARFQDCASARQRRLRTGGLRQGSQQFCGGAFPAYSRASILALLVMRSVMRRPPFERIALCWGDRLCRNLPAFASWLKEQGYPVERSPSYVATLLARWKAAK